MILIKKEKLQKENASIDLLYVIIHKQQNNQESHQTGSERVIDGKVVQNETALWSYNVVFNGNKSNWSISLGQFVVYSNPTQLLKSGNKNSTH